MDIGIQKEARPTLARAIGLLVGTSLAEMCDSVDTDTDLHCRSLYTLADTKYLEPRLLRQIQFSQLEKISVI